MSSRRAAAALLLVCSVLAACSAPTLADACRNICACDRACGPTDADGSQARCEANGYAQQETAASRGCGAEYDALVACIYTASCAELADGCSTTTQVLLQCEEDVPR